MVLSDRDIIRRIAYGNLDVEPYEESNVEPASMDLRLGSDFTYPKRYERDEVIDLREDDTHLRLYDKEEDETTVCPGQFVLATTLETIKMPDDLCAEVLGRSSLGRLGISIHQTAGYIDPGFEGQITLEISNHGVAPVHLRKGDRICQIVFEELSSPAESPYGHEKSQYQNQSGATPSGMNFD